MSTTVTYKGGTLTTVENETRTLTTRGKYLEDNITLVDVTSGGEPNLQAKAYTVDGAGTDTVTADTGYDGLSSVEVSVPSAQPLVDSTSGFETVSGARKWYYEPNATAGIMGGYDAGWAEGAYPGRKVSFNAVPSGTTVTPSTSAQTVGGTKHMMEGAVTVNAIPPQYIIPSGNKAITENGTGIDVAQYETVSVNVSGGGGGITVEALSVTQNGTYTAPTGKAYSPVTVNVSGGASNVVTGTFTGTTTGAVMTVDIQNSGNKQPIAFFIYPSAGMYNPNGTFYNALQRYAILSFFAVRNVFPIPTDDDAGTTVVRYKSSSSNATSYSQTGGTGNLPFTTSAPADTTAASTANVGVNAKGTKLKVFIANGSYGFMANVEYTYYIIFES